MGTGKLIGLLLIGLLGLFAATGFYSIRDGEVGVVQRFGSMVRTETPGLKWRIPLIERASIVSTSQNLRLDVTGPQASSFSNLAGNRSLDDLAPNRMVTRDLNLVELDFTVFWQISDPVKYLFNVREPVTSLRMAAESVVREVVGRTNLEDIISVASADLPLAPVADGEAPAAPVSAAPSLGSMAQDMETRLQKLVDTYNAGIAITDLQITRVSPPIAVADSFAKVQQARQQATSAINQAQAYANTTRAEADGQASRIKAEATAYKSQVIASAKGDADRFVKVLDAYKLSEDTTATRLYLETMESVMKGANKVLLDSKGANNVLPYLPLPGLTRPSATSAATPSALAPLN
jgi:membrane protease subunit HflK